MADADCVSKLGEAEFAELRTDIDGTEHQMPLKRSLDRILSTMLGVKFLMEDGKTEVACRADRKLLRHRFGSSDCKSDAAAFDLHREEIEQAASDKYDAGKIEPHTDATVVVSEVDLASPLSKIISVYAFLLANSFVGA